jgi:hypothetical protein
VSVWYVHVSYTPHAVGGNDPHLNLQRNSAVNNKLLITKHIRSAAATSLSGVFSSRKIFNEKYAF